jgi:phosphoglucomutase
MNLHEQAGKQIPESRRANIARLVSSYYTDDIKKPVSFGTSGHRGSSLNGTFNELHIAATVQAICEYRSVSKINGPLYFGFDTHALSEPAFRTSLEVLAANKITVFINKGDEYTPTPVISFMILEHNKKKSTNFADGIVITPSHNPPEDGGIKYNPPSGGPADKKITSWIENRANQISGREKSIIKRIPYEAARKTSFITEQDFITPFVDSLSQVVDMDIIQQSGIKIGIDPMGGAGVNFWQPIADRYNLNMDIINPAVDQQFGFMTADWDGKIRMDCSSVHAMTKLIDMADKFDIAWGNDPDFDRHGIVTPRGLMNPNHYLSTAIWYLLQNRPDWKKDLLIGKTLVSSSMIDKVARGLNRKIFEVPVGFKWFVKGLQKGSIAFGGEESAGATFLRKNGDVWTTDKDGFCMTLLAAEILAKTDKTPEEIYQDILVPKYGNPYYKRIDSPVSEEEKEVLSCIDPESLKGTTIAGIKTSLIITKAPGNNSSMGGLKIMLKDGSWCAVRPSGTEAIMKFYIESFGGEDLVEKIHKQAQNTIFNNKSV